MDLYLIRHAQSHANVNYNLLRKETNIGIELTPIGQQQALESANFLAKQAFDKPVKIWISPYTRTRLTAQSIYESLSCQFACEQEESIHIAERQLGLVDDVSNYEENYPYEYAHYQLHTKNKHEYFVRPPLGESAFDMSLRLEFFLRVVLAAPEEQGKTHIVVTHGACVRGLITAACKQPYEYYMSLANPANASICQVKNKQHDYIFIPSMRTD